MKGCRSLCLWVMIMVLVPAAAWPQQLANGARKDLARKKYDSAIACLNASDVASAITALSEAIEADPDFPEAHDTMISCARMGAAGADTYTRVRELYRHWAARYPKKAVFQWAQGKMLNYGEGFRFFRKAVELEPDFLPAYENLPYLAESSGDRELAAKYAQKLASLKPDDPELLSKYISLLANTNSAEYHKARAQLMQKFSGSEPAVRLLFNEAGASSSTEARIGRLEQLLAAYPPEKYQASQRAALQLYAIYADTESPRLMPFVDRMSKMRPSSKVGSWNKVLDFEQKLSAARSLLVNKEHAQAAALLETAVPAQHGTEALLLLKAEAWDGLGDTTKAFNLLLKVAGSEPTDRLLAALYRYGKKLGKSQQNVQSDVWQLVRANSMASPEFTLKNYDGGRVSSADLKGKIVLLNFWNPT